MLMQFTSLDELLTKASSNKHGRFLLCIDAQGAVLYGVDVFRGLCVGGGVGEAVRRCVQPGLTRGACGGERCMCALFGSKKGPVNVGRERANCVWGEGERRVVTLGSKGTVVGSVSSGLKHSACG